MEEEVTAELILDWLKLKVEAKDHLNPEIWVDAAHKLTVFLGDEQDTLFDLQQEYSQKKLSIYDEMEKPSVSASEMRGEATDEYKKFKKQEARVKQIEEFIRVSKLRARIAGGF